MVILVADYCGRKWAPSRAAKAYIYETVHERFLTRTYMKQGRRRVFKSGPAEEAIEWRRDESTREGLSPSCYGGGGGGWGPPPPPPENFF